MSREDQTVSFSLEVNVEPGYTQLRKVQMILFRTLGLMRQLGLPTPIDRAIAKLMQLITIANQARLTLLALHAVRMATGDPLAWGMFLVSAGSTMVSASAMLEVEGR